MGKSPRDCFAALAMTKEETMTKEVANDQRGGNDQREGIISGTEKALAGTFKEEFGTYSNLGLNSIAPQFLLCYI